MSNIIRLADRKPPKTEDTPEETTDFAAIEAKNAAKQEKLKRERDVANRDLVRRIIRK